MKRVIIFRFHKLPSICLERVKFLKRLNPSVDIFGLYGGEADELPIMRETLGPFCADISSLAEYAPSWKWRFGDLAVRQWFINVGNRVPFDVAHIIEWDLLLCRPLHVMYSHIAADTVGLTGLRRVKDVEHFHPFISQEPLSLEWKNLLHWARSKHGYSLEPLLCLGPGYCLPRSFLESLSRLVMPELSMDELRLPLAAQILGFNISDTRLCRSFQMEEEVRVFNTIKKEVPISTVVQELEQMRGRRAFHPVFASLADAEILLPGAGALRPSNGKEVCTTNK